MKKFLALALGIFTSVGGFFDVGNLATSAQAGASYRFQLVWALLLGTILVIFLIEMSGRFAAVTGKALPDAIREHFGFNFWLLPFGALLLIHFLVLATEIGGICFALHLVSGLSTVLWAMPVALLLWVFLWRATFAAIENSTSLLGLITLAFVVAAVAHHPPTGQLLAGMLPSLPAHEPATYWFIAVSIIGSVIAPYLFYFYSSGTVEDGWDASYVKVNRGIAFVGMGFGGVISLGALVVAAMTFGPRGIAIEDYHQAALMLTTAFPFWGFLLFAISMGIACVGAALEVALSLAYMSAQTLGWNWGENLKPKANARFAVVYSAAILLSALVIQLGVDPLRLTLLSMALSAAVLPVVAVPFLLLMNDRTLLGEHVNGPISNAVALLSLAISFVLAVISIPLVFLAG